MKTQRPISVSRQRREGGVILLLGCLCLPVIMGMLGISVDLSVLYTVKARLQTACDGAAVAALRSLSLGQTISSQTTAATTVANNWFKANYSNGFMGTTNTSNPPTVAIAQNAVTLLTTVDVTASTTVPTYFMKYWNAASNVITATSQASRRNVVITLVLDRAGSMNSATNTVNGMTPCAAMKAAAKQFTGMFQPTRDYIGLVTFAETGIVQSVPSTGFQTTLGYTNSAGSGTGLIDNITCSGGTNTSTGIALGYNENYKIQLPGALNVIVLMTDGLPTAASFKFITTAALDPSGQARSAFSGTSGCKDSTGKAMSSGGNMVTNPTNWIVTESNATAGNPAGYYLGANSISGWSYFSGPIAALYADSGSSFVNGVDPNFMNSISQVATLENKSMPTTDALGCSGLAADNATSDLAWIPDKDIFGISSGGYHGTLTTTSTLGANRIQITTANMININYNLVDNIANFARTDRFLPNGSTAYSGNVIFTIGLGGNGGVDHTLLQRAANDPNASPTGAYSAYAGYNTNQPIGTYVFAPAAADLSQAFQCIAAQILRLSK